MVKTGKHPNTSPDRYRYNNLLDNKRKTVTTRHADEFCMKHILYMYVCIDKCGNCANLQVNIRNNSLLFSCLGVAPITP